MPSSTTNVAHHHWRLNSVNSQDNLKRGIEGASLTCVSPVLSMVRLGFSVSGYLNPPTGDY
jgi:hypothetical protein